MDLRQTRRSRTVLLIGLIFGGGMLTFSLLQGEVSRFSVGLLVILPLIVLILLADLIQGRKRSN